MTLLIRERGGDTLAGVIDGSNAVFRTTFNYIEESVAVFVNGRLKVASLDDGYTLTPPNIVVLKEPPLALPDFADTLEIEYRSDVKTGGGALGGVPSAPEAVNLQGSVASGELEPLAASTENLEPIVSTDVPAPTASIDELVPRLIPSGD